MQVNVALDDELISVIFDKPLVVGATYVVHVSFADQLESYYSRGLFCNSYTINNVKKSEPLLVNMHVV